MAMYTVDNVMAILSVHPQDCVQVLCGCGSVVSTHRDRWNRTPLDVCTQNCAELLTSRGTGEEEGAWSMRRVWGWGWGGVRGWVRGYFLSVEEAMLCVELQCTKRDIHVQHVCVCVWSRKGH